METWARLFERAEEYDATVAEIEAALAERRSGDAAVDDDVEADDDR